MSLENLNSTEQQIDTGQETKIQALNPEEAKTKLAEIQKQNEFLSGKSDTVREKFLPKMEKKISSLKAGIEVALTESEDMELIGQLDEIIKELAVLNTAPLETSDSDAPESKEEQEVKINPEQVEKIVDNLNQAIENIQEVVEKVKKNKFLDKHKVKIAQLALGGLILIGGSNTLNNSKSIEVGDFTMDKSELQDNWNAKGKERSVENALKFKHFIRKYMDEKTDKAVYKGGSTKDKGTWAHGYKISTDMVDALTDKKIGEFYDILEVAMENPERYGLDRNSLNFVEEAIRKLELGKVIFGKQINKAGVADPAFLYGQANDILEYIASPMLSQSKRSEFTDRYSHNVHAAWNRMLDEKDQLIRENAQTREETGIIKQITAK